MHEEYQASYDLLWNEGHDLFFRDSRYFPEKEDNGHPLMWSRGNGWVFGGLAILMPELPSDWEHRLFYVDLYKTMAESVMKLQREDGMWNAGLLGGTDAYPYKETSGTAFFTFGFAWGINNGLLERETYEAIVLKAWEALQGCVTPEGMVAFVQPIGKDPEETYPDKSEVYGVGAFLAACAEVYKMLGSVPEAEV